MKINLTIGTIWQGTRNQKHFELTAINKETGKIQLSSADNEQSFTCMTEASLHKHYKLIALTMKEFRPVTVTTQAVDEIIPEHVEIKIEKKKEVSKEVKIVRKAGKVQLEDGSIVSAKSFIIDICKKTPEETYKRETYAYSVAPWLQREKKLLEQYKAKVI